MVKILAFASLLTLAACGQPNYDGSYGNPALNMLMIQQGLGMMQGPPRMQPVFTDCYGTAYQQSCMTH